MRVWANAEYRAKEYRGLEAVQVNGKSEPSDNKLYFRSFAVVNVGTSYQPVRDVAINFGIDNLFNQNFMDYQEPQAYGARGTGYQNRYARVDEGRRVWMKLNYEF